ncbi:T9SS type A sorting domain-containing protein [Sediminibacter sp. Hel_I_10]|uniref:T9SS type A sorting domain-containing protein n=1 Tax=Sediminibacter sp. Hel_I_10 TaxID=1392490 RepID=UPI00047E271C|nr:T9SS type A sorting domain-containing protein [Sediminibacter sp. Hel_I_10]
MKKKLLFSLLALPLLTFSQSIRSESFNGLTIGNITGQSTWVTLPDNGEAGTTTTNQTEAALQIVSTGDNSSNGFELTGPNGNDGGSFAWNDGFATAWAARTSGNDILEVEFSVNPGGLGSESKNNFGIYVYDATYTKVLAGITINQSTNEISLVTYSFPAGQMSAGNFRYSLAAGDGLIVPSDVFSTYGFSYNSATGEVLIDGPGIVDGPISVDTNVAVDTPAEVDFFAFSGSTAAEPNSTSSSMIFDNFMVKASDSNTLLNVNSLDNKIASFFLSPNPATNFIQLTSNADIEAVSITNSIGQTVLEINNVSNNTLDISELNSGLYLITVKSGASSQTKRFIKQ